MSQQPLLRPRDLAIAALLALTALISVAAAAQGSTPVIAAAELQGSSHDLLVPRDVAVCGAPSIPTFIVDPTRSSTEREGRSSRRGAFVSVRLRTSLVPAHLAAAIDHPPDSGADRASRLSWRVHLSDGEDSAPH